MEYKFIDNKWSKGREHRKIMKPILLDALEELFPNEQWDVHHRDGDRTNNDIFNLEVMNHKVHTGNHFRGKQRGKFRGAFYTNRKSKPWNKVWSSQIIFNGKRQSLGYFNDPLSAEIVFNFVWEELHGLREESL